MGWRWSGWDGIKSKGVYGVRVNTLVISKFS